VNIWGKNTLFVGILGVKLGIFKENPHYIDHPDVQFISSSFELVRN
jgi:hypothetical protein